MNTHILYKSKTGADGEGLQPDYVTLHSERGFGSGTSPKRILYTCLEHVHDVFLCVWEKTDTTHSKVKELLFIERLCNIDALKSILILYCSLLPLPIPLPIPPNIDHLPPCSLMFSLSTIR